MDPELLAKAIVVLLCAAITVFIVGRWLPWMYREYRACTRRQP